MQSKESLSAYPGPFKAIMTQWENGVGRGNPLNVDLWDGRYPRERAIPFPFNWGFKRPNNVSGSVGFSPYDINSVVSGPAIMQSQSLNQRRPARTVRAGLQKQQVTRGKVKGITIGG